MDMDMDMEPAKARFCDAPAVIWEPVNPVQSPLSYWMKSGHRRFSKSFGRLLSECGIIASEWSALRELYGPRRQSPMELGVTIGMSKGGASKLVSRLVAKRLVVKETADFDRRFRSVGLTKQGRELVVFLASIEKDADRTFFRSLGNGGRFRLREWLKRVLDPGRSPQLDQWVSTRLAEKDFIKADPDAQAKAFARAKAEYEELDSLFRRVAEAAAAEMFGSG